MTAMTLTFWVIYKNCSKLLKPPSPSAVCMSAADWFLSGGQNGCFPGDFADGLHLSASASEFFSDGPAPHGVVDCLAIK